MFFNVFGLNINVITLTAMILLLGILVDDAIVISEKIFTNRKKGLDAETAGIEGAMSMIKPVAAAITTTVLAFIPLLFIKGVIGRFMQSIPIVVVLLLAVSFVDAIVFIPAHLKNAAVSDSNFSWKDRFIQKIITFYKFILEKCLTHRIKFTVSYIIILLLMIIVSINFITFIVDEDIDPDFFNIIIEAPEGTPLEKTVAYVEPVEEILAGLIPVEALQGMTSQIGHHDTDVFGSSSGQYSNWAIISVNLKPAAQRKITSEEIVAEVSKKLAVLKSERNYKKLRTGIIEGLPVGKPIDITLISSDENLLDMYEKSLIQILENTQGISKIETSNTPGKDEILLKLNYLQLGKTGLTPMDVAGAVRSAFEGTVVTSIKMDGENINFRVRLKDPQNYREKNILNIPITNSYGRLIELKNIAYLSQEKSKASILHYNGRRAVTITADVDSDVITPLKANNIIKNYFQEKVAKTPDFRIIYGGQQAETEESMRSFMFAGIIVILSIYFILVIVFDSYLQPVLIMSIIPFAIAATLLTLVMHGRPLIMISLLGMLGLIGVVVNDTIVMIAHLNEKTDRDGFSIPVIIDAASERFRPVILTTLTTFAGLLPTAYGFGGDIPSIRPMVLVMAWGLVFCTTVTLGFVPLVYSFWGGKYFSKN